MAQECEKCTSTYRGMKNPPKELAMHKEILQRGSHIRENVVYVTFELYQVHPVSVLSFAESAIEN